MHGISQLPCTNQHVQNFFYIDINISIQITSGFQYVLHYTRNQLHLARKGILFDTNNYQKTALNIFFLAKIKGGAGRGSFCSEKWRFSRHRVPLRALKWLFYFHLYQHWHWSLFWHRSKYSPWTISSWCYARNELLIQDINVILFLFNF